MSVRHRSAGLQMPEAHKGKEMQGGKPFSPEAFGVFSALTLEDFEQYFLENGLSLTYLSSMIHPQELSKWHFMVFMFL